MSEQVALSAFARRDADLHLRAAGFQQQFVVARSQPREREHAVLYLGGAAAIGDKNLPPDFQQRDQLVQRPVFGVHQRDFDRLALATVNGAVIRMPVNQRRPGVRHALRAGDFQPGSAGEFAQRNTPLLVGFQRHVHRLFEVVVLDLELHRAVGERFAAAAEEVDEILAFNMGEVQVLDLVGPRDLVESEDIGRRQVDFLVLAEVLNFAQQLERDRGEPPGHLKFVGSFPVLKQLEIVGFLCRHHAVAVL